MSETTCPDCHAVVQGDAKERCAACGRRLDVPPLHLDAVVKKKGSNWIAQGLFIAALLGGSVLVVEAALQSARGNILIAIYNSIGLVAILCAFVARNNLRIGSKDRPRERASLLRMAVLVAVGVVMYLGIRYVATLSDSSTIAGTRAPDHYQNDYFNVQLSFGPPWQDVTEAARRQTTNTAVGPNLLLALTRLASDDDTTVASLMFTAVKIPTAETGYTSSDHLDMMVSNLMKRSDHPRDVKTEKQSTFGGIDFDRLSLTRPWGDQEMGMTFWAAQQRGYLILITGSYPTADGLLASEELLTKMAEAHSK